MALAKPLLSVAIARKQGKVLLVPHGGVTCCTSSSSSSSTSFGGGISLTASVRSPLLEPSLKWQPDSRHVIFLNTIALCAAVVSSWVFFSAIPSLLALKKAAISTEKLLDTKREGLPHTMAMMRRSGMEINDLIMEISQLGQEMSVGVRNSTQFLHQIPLSQPNVPKEDRDEGVSSGIRKAKEGIVKFRSTMANLLVLSQLSRQVLGFFAARKRRY